MKHGGPAFNNNLIISSSILKVIQKISGKLQDQFVLKQRKDAISKGLVSEYKITFIENAIKIQNTLLLNIFENS